MQQIFSIIYMQDYIIYRLVQIVYSFMLKEI